MSEKQVFRALYIAWLIAAGILVVAVAGRHPYAFYAQLRWICCAAFVFSVFAFVYSAVDCYRSCKNDPGPSVADPITFQLAIAALFAAGAVLFNPVAPFHFRRETWLLIDKLSLGVVIFVALTSQAKLDLPAVVERWYKWLVWLIVTGLVTYYTAQQVIHLYGKYALATATGTARIYHVDEETGESDTGQSGVKYTGVYRFLVNGKTYYGRTDNYTDVGDKLAVRYNPANPDENRDSTEDFFAGETWSIFGTVIIFGALYLWLKWILQSEKTLPCVKHQDRQAKKRFYHWVENGRFHYVVDDGPRCDECLAELRELHRVDGCSEFLYKPLPEPFSV
jgi:hypothetical protein